MSGSPRGLRSWLRPVAGVLLTLAAALWVAYRITNARSMTGRISVDTACDTDVRSVAELSPLTPGAAPVRCEPWDIGTGVTGYVWRAPAPRAALLLQTAWGDYAQRYARDGSRLIPHLLERGISVHAFDLWGSGRSPGPRGATDIRQATLDHLAARRKLREQALPVFTLGHSVGGLVTATSAVSDQEGLRGVILVAPALDWNVGGVMRLVARVGGVVAPGMAVPGPPGGGPQTSDSVALRRLNEDPLMHHGSISWLTASTGLTVSRRNWMQYQELRVPILVVHGGADRAPDPSGSRKLLALVASNDKTLRIIPEGLHALFDDIAGPDVVQIVLAWLDRQLASPPPAP